MLRDKKAVAGTLTLVLPRRLGEVAVLRNVPVERVLAVLRECLATPANGSGGG
ncbi:MAG: hypothetical protein H5T97_13625 [Firmicutes bacterium]|nr:hypothetical protein [Bacillota bacterium]